MAQIFVSYARPQATIAHDIASALRARGWQVWRDDDLPPHRAYGEVIEERLQQAAAVLVLWSADAAGSQWVRAEADFGRNAGKLVQLSLDGTMPPMPFNQIQCDTITWPPAADDRAWAKVAASIGHLCGDGAAPITPQPAPQIIAEVKEPMLAVLAFENLSSDPETGYFSDGVSEDILQAVARAGYIKVAGRSSSFAYRGTQKAAATIGTELGVSHVLDGSVRRAGARIRISASLIECASQATLWSDRFDREIADVFALQDEISQAVAAALEAPLAPTRRSNRIDPKAYDLYLKARALASSPLQAPECIALLEQAVARAPDFAAAWASLAVAIAVDMRFRDRGAHCAEMRPSAIAAANRAIGLDVHAAPAYVALSLAEPIAAFAAREAWIAKALAAQPNDVESLKFAADFAQAVGRIREAFDLTSRAQAVDPLNWLVANNYGTALADMGFYRACYEAFDAGRARWPDMVWFTTVPLNIAGLIGDWAEADRLLALDVDWTNRDLATSLAVTNLLRDPNPAAVAGVTAQIESQFAKTKRLTIGAILSLQSLGKMDTLFDLVEQASFAHAFDPNGEPLDRRLLIGTLFGHFAVNLRRDPRFLGLCAKLGLVRYWYASDRWPDCATDGSLGYDFGAEAAKYRAG